MIRARSASLARRSLSAMVTPSFSSWVLQILGLLGDLLQFLVARLELLLELFSAAAAGAASRNSRSVLTKADPEIVALCARGRRQEQPREQKNEDRFNVLSPCAIITPVGPPGGIGAIVSASRALERGPQRELEELASGLPASD